MSRFGVIPAALFDEGISPDEIAVACLLSVYADKSGWCFPSLETMATKLGRDRAYVSRAISKLEARQLVQVKRGGGRESSRYRLLFDRDWGVAPVQSSVAPVQSSVAPVQPNSTNEHIERERSQRGTRLRDDWHPEPVQIAGIEAINLDGELAKFRDYWRAVPGSRGVKLDWQATWRNWLRNCLARQRPTGGRTEVRGGDRVQTTSERNRARLHSALGASGGIRDEPTIL